MKETTQSTPGSGSTKDTKDPNLFHSSDKAWSFKQPADYLSHDKPDAFRVTETKK